VLNDVCPGLILFCQRLMIRVHFFPDWMFKPVNLHLVNYCLKKNFVLPSHGALGK